MDIYHIALFVHVFALVAAAGAHGAVTIAMGRRLRARTLADALEWHRVMMSATRIFPAALVTFLVTGGYMVSRGSTQTWQAGFVVAGVTGVVLLFASGTYLGIKGKGLATALEGMIAKIGPDQPPPRVAPPALVRLLPAVNPMIALAVVFDMVTKPASPSVALTVLAIGIAIPVASFLLRSSAAPVAGESLSPAEPG